MNFSMLLAEALAAPHDLWTIILNWILGSVVNYGWTILLFTMLVKFVLSPLDFGVKYTSKKQSLIQKKCAPEIAKLNKKYGADQQTVKVQTNALYKREGLNAGTGCIVMLINMILTIVIFFSLFSALRNVSAYEAIRQYNEVEQSYETAYYDSVVNYSAEDDITTRDEAKTAFDTYFAAKSFIENTENNDSTEGYDSQKAIYDKYKGTFTDENLNAFTIAGSDAAVQTWNSVKSSFLWIENIWVADSTNASPFPNYDELLSIANNGGYGEYVQNNINKDTCNRLANMIVTNTGRAQNGYFIIAILSGVVTFLSQFISQLHNRLKNKKANALAKASEKSMGTSMKVMMIAMPIIMVIFAVTTGAAFGIYIVSSSIASIIIGEISTLIIDCITKKKREEVEAYLEKEANRLIKKGRFQE